METRKRTVIRRSRGQTVAWCKQCCEEVLILTPEEAAALVRLPAREIFRRIEMGELHYLETDDGTLLIGRNLPSRECVKT